MTILSNKWSEFQNDLINIQGYATSKILILFGIALCFIVSIQNNVIPIGSVPEMRIWSILLIKYV